MTVFVYKGAGYDPRRCCQTVIEGGRASFFHQCNFKWTIERTHEGKKLRFCKIHDPVAVEEKEARKQAAYDAKWAEEHRLDMANKNARRVLQKIAAGSPEARVLAQEALARYPREKD